MAVEPIRGAVPEIVKIPRVASELPEESCNTAEVRYEARGPAQTPMACNIEGRCIPVLVVLLQEYVHHMCLMRSGYECIATGNPREESHAELAFGHLRRCLCLV